MHIKHVYYISRFDLPGYGMLIQVFNELRVEMQKWVCSHWVSSGIQHMQENEWTYLHLSMSPLGAQRNESKDENKGWRRC